MEICKDLSMIASWNITPWWHGDIMEQYIMEQSMMWSWSNEHRSLHKNIAPWCEHRLLHDHIMKHCSLVTSWRNTSWGAPWCDDEVLPISHTSIGPWSQHGTSWHRSMMWRWITPWSHHWELPSWSDTSWIDTSWCTQSCDHEVMPISLHDHIIERHGITPWCEDTSLYDHSMEHHSMVTSWRETSWGAQWCDHKAMPISLNAHIKEHIGIAPWCEDGLLHDYIVEYHSTGTSWDNTSWSTLWCDHEAMPISLHGHIMEHHGIAPWCEHRPLHDHVMEHRSMVISWSNT